MGSALFLARISHRALARIVDPIPPLLLGCTIAIPAVHRWRIALNYCQRCSTIPARLSDSRQRSGRSCSNDKLLDHGLWDRWRGADRMVHDFIGRHQSSAECFR